MKNKITEKINQLNELLVEKNTELETINAEIADIDDLYNGKLLVRGNIIEARNGLKKELSDYELVLEKIEEMED